MSTVWDQITNEALDLEMAFSVQPCFNDQCRDVFAVGETEDGDMWCTRASNHVTRERAAGFTPVHALGFAETNTRVRWT
jgi:hypothetical protein